MSAQGTLVPRLALLTGALAATTVLAFGAARVTRATDDLVQFVFTSDAHYGLTRPAFRGATNADATRVNAALVESVNGLPSLRFPDDGGVRAGREVGWLDFLAEGGDIANRQEDVADGTIQRAAVSWSQFVHDYVDGLRTRTREGTPTRLFVVPGNHDASNALGFYRRMSPATDSTAFISIYNLMLRPPQPLSTRTLDYGRDRFFTSVDLGGLHLQFLQIWPDSIMRSRMAADLASVSPDTPVVVFTHDQPDAEGKHFRNPNGAHTVNDVDRFENLLADTFADGPDAELTSLLEQAELEAFLVQHRNVTAYFHGNSNWHQAYDWNGPHRQARIHAFRVDSPMKGAVSAQDETRLSFHVVSVDAARGLMTVRECLWNVRGASTTTPSWGASVTVSLAPAPHHT